MSGFEQWQSDLEGYIREGELDKAYRADAWQTAVGLQDVDGLKTSEHLADTAREHIEGRISIDEAQSRILSYHEERKDRLGIEEPTKEGDIVSSHMVRLLGERAFVFSPVQLKTVHRVLFEGLLDRAGEYRIYNITKKEWVLKGDTIIYAPAGMIEDALTYDFSQEKSFAYGSLSKDAAIRHVASFISGIWQIHPFCEGNTRTTAVFALKYLSSIGFETNNDAFKSHSWYFRNALVRANYENYETGVRPTKVYLERFFENLLLGGQHELRNRYLHVDWREDKNRAAVTPQVTLQVTI